MTIEKIVQVLKNAGVNLATIGSEADRKARIEEVKKVEDVRVHHGYTKGQIYDAVKTTGGKIFNVTYNKLLTIEKPASTLKGSAVTSPVGAAFTQHQPR